jgi:hypothetical protein
MHKGAKTPDVFDQVYESRMFPGISAAVIRELYYEQKRRLSMPRARTFQKSAAKRRKTTRS